MSEPEQEMRNRDTRGIVDHWLDRLVDVEGAVHKTLVGDGQDMVVTILITGRCPSNLTTEEASPLMTAVGRPVAVYSEKDGVVVDEFRSFTSVEELHEALRTVLAQMMRDAGLSDGAVKSVMAAPTSGDILGRIRSVPMIDTRKSLKAILDASASLVDRFIADELQVDMEPWQRRVLHHYLVYGGPPEHRGDEVWKGTDGGSVFTLQDFLGPQFDDVDVHGREPEEEDDFGDDFVRCSHGKRRHSGVHLRNSKCIDWAPSSWGMFKPKVEIALANIWESPEIRQRELDAIEGMLDNAHLLKETRARYGNLYVSLAGSDVEKRDALANLLMKIDTLASEAKR